MTPVHLLGAGLLAAHLLAMAGPAPQEESPTTQQPLDSGLSEEVEVNIMILEVEPRDRQGRPIPGLALDDFELFLGARPWPIDSVDDFCACANEPGERRTGAEDGGTRMVEGATPAAGEAAASADAESAGAVAAAVAAAREVLFVLYFDLSQMQPDGRSRAFPAARRWLQETRRAGDRVQIVAHASRPGLVRLTDFTADAGALLQALESLEGDDAFFDEFPARFRHRVEECRRCVKQCIDEGRCPGPPGCNICCSVCPVNAQQEYSHGRRSLRVLRQFLAALAQQPGRKQLLLFGQNNVLFPARFYIRNATDADFRVGTQIRLATELAAEATASRTTLHALNTGASRAFSELADAAANLGANLADFTGGTYNQAPGEMTVLMDAAVNACPCSYRLAFKPPRPGQAEIINARVFVRGRRLPFSYRVRNLTAAQRMVRQVEAVLDHAESFSDFAIHASLTPLRRTAAGWDVAASVLVSVDELAALPGHETTGVAMDAGALLQPVFLHGGGRIHELLAGAQVRWKGMPPPDRWISYRHEFTGLGGGTYRLAGYLRTRPTDLVSGAQTEIVLPGPGQSGLVGPFLFHPEQRHFTIQLPLRRDEDTITAAPVKASNARLPAPAGIIHGQPALFITWSCGAGRQAPAERRPAPIRELLRLGQPVPVEGNLQASGEEAGCAEMVDVLPTTKLEPGTYVYAVEQSGMDEGGAVARVELEFVIRAGPLAPAAGP